MHPLVFLAACEALAVLFALQEYAEVHTMGWHISLWIILEGWSIQFLAWGVVGLGLWYFLRRHLEGASVAQILLQYLPVSLLLSVSVEMVYVFCFRYQKPGYHLGYWQRLRRDLGEDFVSNVAFFWIMFALFRGIGYYRKFRERERVAAQLEAQLVNARLQALRMQLNPHFLFNTLNSVSSLMRIDVELADEMLERLSSLLRMTLEKRDTQKIRLQEEIEIVQLYVSIQQLRYGDRVKHIFHVEPEAWDLLVPTMILQPIVENAYLHGVSRCLGDVTIEIRAGIREGWLYLSVRNSCASFTSPMIENRRPGVGIANVKARLKLHYGEQQSFSFEQAAPGNVTALFQLPLAETGTQPGEETGVAIYANSDTDRG